MTEPTRNPYALDTTDAITVGVVAASVALDQTPKSFWGKVGSSIAIGLGAVGGLMIVKWASHKLFSSPEVKPRTPKPEEINEIVKETMHSTGISDDIKTAAMAMTPEQREVVRAKLKHMHDYIDKNWDQMMAAHKGESKEKFLQQLLEKMPLTPDDINALSQKSNEEIDRFINQENEPALTPEKQAKFDVFMKRAEEDLHALVHDDKKTFRAKFEAREQAKQATPHQKE